MTVPHPDRARDRAADPADQGDAEDLEEDELDLRLLDALEHTARLGLANSAPRAAE